MQHSLTLRKIIFVISIIPLQSFARSVNKLVRVDTYPCGSISGRMSYTWHCASLTTTPDLRSSNAPCCNLATLVSNACKVKKGHISAEIMAKGLTATQDTHTHSLLITNEGEILICL